MHLSRRITDITLAALFLNACAPPPAGAQTTQPTTDAQARETHIQDQLLQRSRVVTDLPAEISVPRP